MANIFVLSLLLLNVCGVWETNAGFFLDEVGASIDGDMFSGSNGRRSMSKSFRESPHQSNDDSRFASFDGFSRGSNDDDLAQASFGEFESPLKNNNQQDFRSGLLNAGGGGRRGGSAGGGNSGGARESPMKKKWREKQKKKTQPTKDLRRIVIQTTKKGHINEYPPQKAWKNNRKPQAPGDPLDDM